MHKPLSHRFTAIFAVFALCLVAAATPVNAAGQGDPDLSGASVDLDSSGQTVSGIWDLTFLPDGRAIVTGASSLYVRSTNGSMNQITADLSDIALAGEGGLLGVVADPNYGTNRRFYTCQNTSGPKVQVVAWQMNSAHTAAVRVIDPLIDNIGANSSGRHSGCRLRFGFEGYLYIATGDAAIGTNPQSLTSLAGKVLRVHPSTGKGHPDNPFISSGNANSRLIFTYGHRNPQGLDRRPCTEQMWTGEHGPSVDDEVNLLRKGGNYGWNPVGSFYNESVPMTDTAEFPNAVVARWDSGSSTIALSGINFVTGADWGGYDGALAGAALRGQTLSIWEFGDPGPVLQRNDRDIVIDGEFGRLRSPQMGPDGSLYVAAGSSLIQITPPNGPNAGDQDLNGDGFDDLVVGAPGEAIGSRDDAGAISVLYGRSAGLATGSNEARSQNKIGQGSAESGDAFATSIAYGDIDGDGTTDVLVGSTGENASGRSNAGAVTVACGRTAGIESWSSQSFSQAGPVAGALEAGDEFGAAVALGDFNGDGYDDAAIGAPGENVGSISNAGYVSVLYGSADGLHAKGSPGFSQSGPIPGAAETNDRFGATLATGDFNNDGYVDLAVGAPGEDIGSANSAGGVTIVYGSASGLNESNADGFHQNTSGVPGVVESNDAFGASLAVGDFDNDGRDDLAVGAPGEGIGSRDAAGAVTIFEGSNNGLRTDTAQAFHQNSSGVPGGAEAGDAFGAALATGDFDRDGRDDLAVGAPGEAIGSTNASGFVTVFEGSGSGLTTSGIKAFHQATSGVVGASEANDAFGASLATGDFDNDGDDDLAVGAPGEDIGSRNAAGAVTILEGSNTGIRTSGSYSTTQASTGTGSSEAGDNFGSL